MINTQLHKLYNLSIFVYRLFHKDFSPIVGTNLILFQRWERNLHEAVCEQMQMNYITTVILVHKALRLSTLQRDSRTKLNYMRILNIS